MNETGTSSFRPLAHRRPACRRRPGGAVQLAVRAGRPAGSSSSASRTPMSSAPRNRRCNPSSTACAGSGWTGTRTWCSSRSGGPVPRGGGSCSRAAAPTAASARKRNWKPSASGRSPEKLDYHYAGKCRVLDRGNSRAVHRRGAALTVRFRVPEGETVFDDLVHGDTRFQNETIGDFIIARADGSPVYTSRSGGG